MEFVDVYNNRHEKLNYQKNRKELNNGELRLSSFIWVINDKEEVLIQQRLSNTKKKPNMWGATAGGVKAGENSMNRALRELKEELGIIASKEELEFIGSYKRIVDFVEVWLCKKNVEKNEIIINPDEVQDVRWVTINEFDNMIKEGIGIDTSYDIFKMYYEKFYNRHYELKDGKPVIVKNR